MAIAEMHAMFVNEISSCIREIEKSHVLATPTNGRPSQLNQRLAINGQADESRVLAEHYCH